MWSYLYTRRWTFNSPKSRYDWINHQKNPRCRVNPLLNQDYPHFYDLRSVWACWHCKHLNRSCSQDSTRIFAHKKAFSAMSTAFAYSRSETYSDERFSLFKLIQMRSAPRKTVACPIQFVGFWGVIQFINWQKQFLVTTISWLVLVFRIQDPTNRMGQPQHPREFLKGLYWPETFFLFTFSSWMRRY